MNQACSSKDKAGEYSQTTQWHTVKVFSKFAERIDSLKGKFTISLGRILFVNAFSAGIKST